MLAAAVTILQDLIGVQQKGVLFFFNIYLCIIYLFIYFGCTGS